MAAKGLALVAVSGCKYSFEETGAVYIGSIMRWMYFRKNVEYGKSDLFSDNGTRSKHRERMLLCFGFLHISQKHRKLKKEQRLFE